jgi:hypothetical protein
LELISSSDLRHSFQPLRKKEREQSVVQKLKKNEGTGKRMFKRKGELKKHLKGISVQE